jgi:glycosyltransferase involved in cell wall biosynthesis
MKKIIIATNVGGSLETIIDNKTGFLVDVGDVDKMANLIDKALNLEAKKYQEILENARRNVEDNFSSQKMCEKTIEVYKSLI